MSNKELTDEQVDAVYKEWLHAPGHENEHDLIRRAARAALAAQPVAQAPDPQASNDLADAAGICAARGHEQLSIRLLAYSEALAAAPSPEASNLAQAEAPEGWKLVPVEPCDLLLNSFLAGYGARGGSFNAMHLRDRARRGYRQMLEAVDLAFERGIYPIKGSGND